MGYLKKIYFIEKQRKGWSLNLPNGGKTYEEETFLFPYFSSLSFLSSLDTMYHSI